MIQKTILLTGFEEFEKNYLNLSGEIVKVFDNEFHQYTIQKLILPVSWKRSIEVYKEFFETLNIKPSLVVLLGVYAKKKFSFEKYSLNWTLGRDVDGIQKIGCVNYKTPFLLRTNLDLNEIHKIPEIRNNFSLSRFPGFYLCNYIYYWALYISKNNYPVIFIHIPRKGKLEEILRKIKVAVEEIIKRI